MPVSSMPWTPTWPAACGRWAACCPPGCRAIRSSLTATPPPTRCCTSAGRIWLTDFDRVRLAPAVADLGSYLAVAPASQERALLEGYAEHRPVPCAEQLGVAVARSRLARLADPLRRADPSWRERIGAELAVIESIARSPEKETGWA